VHNITPVVLIGLILELESGVVGRHLGDTSLPRPLLGGSL